MKPKYQYWIKPTGNTDWAAIFPLVGTECLTLDATTYTWELNLKFSRFGNTPDRFFKIWFQVSRTEFLKYIKQYHTKLPVIKMKGLK